MASDTKFFEMIAGIKSELKGLKSEGLEVVDFAVGTLLGTPVQDGTFWIVLGGSLESTIPKKCLGDAKFQLVKKNAPRQASFCEDLTLRAQRHVERFSRKGLVLRVGFESYSRVQEEGPFSYFS